MTSTWPVHASLPEVLDPRHTAVVVVDMQNDYCAPLREMANPGKDIKLMRSSIGPQADLVRRAAELGMLVVYIKNTIEWGHVSESPAYLARRLASSSTKRPEEPDLEYVMEGTWGHEVIDELKDLAPESVIVRKHRASAFVNTNLDLVLRSNDIETVVVTGCVTEGCVASTARDALAYDYYCVLPADCSGSYSRERHDAELKVLGSLLDVVDARTVLNAWDAGLDRPTEAGRVAEAKADAT